MNIFLKAKDASFALKNATTEQKNSAIVAVSNALRQNADDILKANELDVADQIALGTRSSTIDRLRLDKSRINAICADMISVANLEDPVGVLIDEWTASSGILIKKVSVPFGVIGVIYEARPNVTVDVFTLCLKTGNACILKGGSDASRTNAKIVEIIQKTLYSTAIPQDAVQLMPSDRSSAQALITARGYVDLIVPRGSKSLIEYVVSNSLVPVIETGAGVCHTYVSKNADLNLSFEILKNAKMSRPSVCNACETLLVDREIAVEFINTIKTNIPDLVLHGGAEEIELLSILPLLEKGYYTEYGDYHLSVKIVDGVKQAVLHINEHGTHHSDCICTKNDEEAEYFLSNVDSACVYHNASTRFSDGGCFGFGAELGISTQKSHARGPFALKEMTTYQYKIYGKGQVR